MSGNPLVTFGILLMAVGSGFGCVGLVIFIIALNFR